MRQSVVALAVAVAASVIAAALPVPAHADCAVPANPVVAENCLPGTAPSVWDIGGAGSSAIQGYASPFSVAQGQTVDFKVDTAATSYRVDIYRIGWYGGSGARLVTTLRRATPQTQPACTNQAATGLVSCANWATSVSWAVPAGQISGIYLAHLVREDGTPGESHMVFVVRDDDSGSDVLFQTSDTTWQAYNRYGGNSLYTGAPDGRAYKVSYDRPFTTREYAAEDWLFNAEFPMVRWLERNGYDVSYFAGADTDRLGGELREHRLFLSVGHDEYWSGPQRANVEAARDAGVNLGFFSGNEVFWKTRWEDGHRTLVSYKETHENAKVDPSSEWTGTWRDPRFSPPADGGRPENALTGQLFMVNDGATTEIQVPAADGKLRFWRGTSIADLAAGATATLAPSTLGYEWDVDPDNGVRPAGSFRLSSTTVDGAPVLTDYGSTFGSATAEHHLTLYRAPSDALVFGAGTVQWPWGLDDIHDRGGGGPPDPRMQQATLNLFADMGIQPGALQAGLQPAAASTDATAPTAAITSAATIAADAGVPQTVQGTAADEGGGRVAGVEVSVDGGGSWHPAAGRETWTYTWTPTSSATVTPLARAVDDSGNLTGRQRPAASGSGQSGTSGGTATRPGGGSGTRPGGTAAARVTVGPRRLRASRAGRVRLRVACRSSTRCRVRLALRRHGRAIAPARTLTLASGSTRRVALTLKRAARRQLLLRRSLRVVAVATVEKTTTRTSIRLIAPRR